MIRTTPQKSCWPARGATLLLGLLSAGCSQGGTKSTTASEVKLAQSQHMYGFKGYTTFSSFPIKPGETLTDTGTLMLLDDGNYKIGRPDGESSAFPYQLSKTGLFALTVPPPTASSPTPRYSGAFGLEGSTGVYYFTDRYVSAATDPAGLYWGTRVTATAPVLTGDWAAFSLHVVFAATTFIDPDNVGRALAGSITVAADGKVTGTGAESTKSTITFTGSTATFTDGGVTLTLDYKDQLATDTRTFIGASANNVLLGIDNDKTDGESGLLALVKVRTGKADAALLAGDYWIGLETVFVNPSRPGTDAAHGTLTLGPTGAWRLDAVGNQGTTFTYQGTFTATDEGKLTFTVPGTSETWTGAFDQDYKTLVIADNFIETRPTGNPEISIMLGIRKGPAQ